VAVIERIDYAPNWRQQLWDAADPAMVHFGEAIVVAAKREMPASTDGSNGRPPGYARSRMRTLERGRDAFGPYRHLGTDATTPDGTNYPAIVHYGQKPHVIKSHGDYPLRDAHGRVFGRVVNHPGARPNPWAERAARTINGRTIRL
jgi:hypothetical protein